MLPGIYLKDLDVESIARKALADDKLLSELIDGLTLKDETLRYNCFKVIFLISEKYGEALYPRWKSFVELLDSANAYWKMSGLEIIANLTKVDRDGKFDDIFDKYYKLLVDKGTMVAAHAALKSGEIAKAKPHLQTKINAKLLNIDKTYSGKQLDLVKGYIIEAFDVYFEETEERREILEFVKSQRNSTSPRTRRKAEQFLNKRGEEY